MRDLATHQFMEEANGRPRLLTTMTLTTANTSYLSATLPAMSRLLIQPQNITYLKVGDSSISLGAASYSAGGIYLAANEKYYLCLKGTDSNIACISGSAGTLVNIFIME